MSDIDMEIPEEDITEIFKTVPRTTRQVLGAPGVGFYVPIYQWGYNWDSKHIGRLFEDVGRGLRSLIENENSITFLGNLIVIDESIPSDVNRNEISSVRVVIDGQQRLTTILLINVCLHDEIRRRRSKLKVEGQPAFQWLFNEAIYVERSLKKTFAENQERGNGVYQWFPRMIRGNHDSWSCSEENAKYKSPIAAFIHNYLKHIEGNGQTKKYTGYANQIDKNSPLVSKYRVIQRKIENVGKGGDQSLEIPPLNEVAESNIFPAEFPAEAHSILSNGDGQDFKRLVRLVLFANFLMERVTLTALSVKEPDYAFDMFESLNTTGEPLTAFETFKPRVVETVETEELVEYKDSHSSELMRPIEEYLNQFKDAQKRHTETSRLLIPFALAETGYKLSKRHSEQRWYLRNQYDKQDLPEERHKFLEHMFHTAIFIDDTWKKGNGAFGSVVFSNRDLVLICMDLLGKVNHEIAIGSLVRFYSQVQLVSPDDKEAAVSELEKAIKTVTAFFTFWRGSGKTTGDLSDQYRELMVKTFCRCPENQDNQVPLTNLTASKLQKALRDVLEEKAGIKSRDDWVTFSFEQPVYKDRKILTRFMLFAAMHNTTEDPENPVLRVAARRKYLNMLTWEKWKQEKSEQNNLEIEHVAPQNPEQDLEIEQTTPQNSAQDNQQSDVYEKPNLIDCLGNLTLLPKAENSSFGNKPWKVKKELYRILALPTPGELEIRLEELQDMEIELSSSTKNLLRAEDYWEHLSAVCNVENWTAEFVQERSKRLAELVWANIAPWLGFDDE